LAKYQWRVFTVSVYRDPAVTLSAEELSSEEASQLPATIFLGTSTWTFPGWKGIVYKRQYKSEREFSQRCLEEYATIPWFRTVCIDSLFYNPPSAVTLERYASQVPDTFRWVSKVWERITIISYPKHARYGAYAGQPNPDFLNAELFKERVLSAYRSEEVFKRTGPFVFQFAPFSERVMAYEEFIERLANFLAGLPSDFRYGVEIRNKELLSERYFKALNEARVTHCFNHWNSMPPLRVQMRAAADVGGLAADFYIARLLTPLGLNYEDAANAFEPYDKVLRPNPQMRADVTTLAKRAVATGRPAFVTANNKAEGNSALTMATIGSLIVANVSKKKS
jgi:uncharacterized protein YecE (DUF72 family)